MMQWILTHFSDCLVENEVVEEAARRGHLWLLENSNSHEGIEWENSKKWTLDRCTLVASTHWHTYLRTRGEVADYAFYQCNMEELKWAIANGFTLSDYLFLDK
ncbi:LOW QUALITY PROTEIN: hypothetical protein PHMEG_00035798 [Phytophthora megakarya]|uniref:Uncharacterized protein n=1 Tax=Phytophthora megakarya TaxID=4795 RepID=A0A225UN92_9STRA|nr:LOW QUALITY PROTEIN: hypothetical protein PHMEG_00035798 [Phytophthora megakarya]